MFIYFLLGIYLFSLTIIFIFSLGQLHLTLHFLKAKKEKKKRCKLTFASPPFVTIQLPVFNEKYVIERLIEAVANIDYPSEYLEIQVLDDSDDETTTLARQKIEALKAEKNLDIQLIRRPERSGFKAGALAYGMKIAKGEYIAIFDADFLPKPNFLKETLPQFTDKNIGMVQTRWGHINRNYSLLTQIQAFGLDAHFTIEQTGRLHAGSFINFNGTAGVWKKACIEGAGGWQSDTLTEDLDLSYRAQMKGWQFRFLQDIESPAELPVTMPAVKSQQFRWNKGAAETARKHLWNVLKMPIKLTHKLHAFFHLLNSTVFFFLVIAAIISIPMLFIKDSHPELALIFNLGAVFVIGFFFIFFFYWVSVRAVEPGRNFLKFIKTFITFLAVYMGLSLHNAIAVTEGWLGFKTPFIRTPKFNVKQKTDSWKGNVYLKRKISFGTLTEGVLALYFAFGIFTAFWLGDGGLLLFHLMLTLGFGTVFITSVRNIA